MMTKEEAQEIWDLIKDIEVAILTNQSGRFLRGRPMYRVQQHFDGTIWFFTPRASDKVEELEAHPQVCLSYSDADKGVFVSLSGTAGFIEDRTLIHKFWNSSAENMFAKGLDDPEITLLEVHVEFAEVWDTKQSAMKTLFRQVRSRLSEADESAKENKGWGENRKYPLN